MKNSKELLQGIPTDKHFLIGSEVVFETGQRKVKIFLDDEGSLCRLNEKVESDIPTVGEISSDRTNVARNISSWESEKSFSTNNILLSCGAILLLGDRLDNAVLPLLKRDPGAPSDACRLTTPAGRLDTLLEAGNYGELFEEMSIYGFFEGHDVLYAPAVQEGLELPFNAVEKIILAGKKGGVPSAENRRIEFLKHQELGLGGLWEVDIYLDGQVIDSSKDQYLAPDWENNTLEFRKIVMIDLPVEKGGVVQGIADGDGFGREVVVISLKELTDYYRKISSPEINLSELFLRSGKYAINTVATTEPSNGGVFGKFFWGAKQPGQFFTSTLSDFVKWTMNN